MEAISAEVAMLRRRFPSSVAWGLSHRHWAMLSWKRGYCLHPQFYLLFRAATRVLEPAFHLNHVFGSLSDWFYIQVSRRRPTVLTLAASSDPLDRKLLEPIDRFVVECPAGRDELERLGIDGRRVQLIFPPVDLERFHPAPPPSGPLRVLFASSPDKVTWLEARGVPLILDAAALRPDMTFRLLWRPWGNSLARVRQWIEQRGLRNVDVVEGRVDDMAREYQAADVTVAPFTEMSRCKPAPNSLVESMACGRPVVTTAAVGLADVVRDERAGIVCDPTGAALAESLDRISSDWSAFSDHARRTAERWFAERTFLEGYERIYQELM
jgi:glycosyltransferase involved in cell wall biosynthesis